jgi:phosphoribosylformylglycinamidine synthase
MGSTPRSQVLYLKGGTSAASAISEFRIKKLLHDLAPLGITELKAQFRYFAELDVTLETALDAADLTFLFELLDAQEHQPASRAILVTPRLGTVSPWSSKATDILVNCGLHAIRRIEHGIAWQLTGHKGKPVSADVVQAALPLLHDRMTESVLLDERLGCATVSSC